MHFQSLVINTSSVEQIHLQGLITAEYNIGDFKFANSNPDFKLLEPENSSISIADVKHLSNWASLKPFQSTIKVLIIMRSERMTAQAQNSMLKLIEEPPPHTLIILHTSNHMALLPTILSRTRQLLADRNEAKVGSQESGAVEQFVYGDLSQRMDVIDKLLKKEVTRDEIVEFVDRLHAKAKTSNENGDLSTMKTMLKSIKQALIGIRTGTNTRLTLETLAISIKERT